MSQIVMWYDLLNVFVTYGQIEEVELKEIIGKSSPTLRKNIELLNEEIKGIAAIYKHETSYEMEIFDYSAFDKILKGGLKESIDFNSSTKRIAFILKELIEAREYVLIDDLAEKLEVSRGTANRDLQEVKEIVQHFGVDLIGTPNKGLEIKGDEFELRLINLYHIHDFFPTHIFLEDINPFVDKYAKHRNIPENSVNTWKKVLEITLDRISSKNNLTKPIPHYTNYQLNDEAFDELIYQIESLYRISLSQYDIDFISFPLNISNTGAVEKVYMNEPFVRDLYDKMLNHIFKVTSVEFERDELYEKIRFHLLYLLNRLIFRIENYDYFYGEIEKKYPFAYEIGKVGMEKIEELVGRAASEAETSYLAVYFELMMRKDQNKEKEIAIVCNTGKGTAALMKQQITQVLGNNINLKTYTEEEYQQTNLSNYFAVFTTVPLKNVDKKVPLIRITNLFNNEWLHSEWERVKKVNQLHFENVSFIFTKVSPDISYKAQLTSMIESMTCLDMIDKNFQKRIFNREDQQTTVFSNGVAFPHAINFGSKKIIFHLGVLEKNPIENDDIEFIFMVGIPDQMNDKVESELLQLYDYMLSIISNSQKANELHQINNSEEFSKWVRKEVF
ncbi:BglG family transcription antiterminator [Vagococcus fluvialis]|uniref:BglG family transcription antiterminator n=1 Tax=Vagococcus fluvialis TaxID=2738 RepID=UPI001A8CD471|nr:PRD domain-containing protein [Vagococcus fluvialis]MBO0479053.1 PRD domain-containing protein [Vagococcus fluvialis]MBO0483446.1 PRD domain-containing protein [Vagococcus fluvialis]